MRVLHITTGDSGGAGWSACRLHQGLLGADVESRVLCREVTRSQEGVERYAIAPWKYHVMMAWRFRSVLGKAARVLRDPSPDYEQFSFPFSACSVEMHPLVEWADVINLHWIAHVVNYPTFFARVNKPLIWTLHDQNPFLGGFHYAGDEARHSWPVDRRLKAMKTQILQATRNLTVVSPSRWLAACARGSAAFSGRPHRVIPNGIDLALFTPQPREAARVRFGIPREKHVVLFVAQPSGPGAYRKGVDLLDQCAGRLHAAGVHLCGIAPFKNSHIQVIPPMRQEELPALYSAADFLVVPSREDNLPNTMLEAMACGTPVIGTPVGGMLDFVRTGETGVLARDISAEALVDAVHAALHDHTFDRAKIRAFAEAHFSLEQQAAAYCEVYREALENAR